MAEKHYTATQALASIEAGRPVANEIADQMLVEPLRRDVLAPLVDDVWQEFKRLGIAEG